VSWEVCCGPSTPVLNAAGSIDVFSQHVSRPDDRLANWLPAPAGRFNLTTRRYWPTEQAPSILDGNWAPPAVTRLGDST
jgi:hypothetical protein